MIAQGQTVEIYPAYHEGVEVYDVKTVSGWRVGRFEHKGQASIVFRGPEGHVSKSWTPAPEPMRQVYKSRL